MAFFYFDWPARWKNKNLLVRLKTLFLGVYLWFTLKTPFFYPFYWWFTHFYWKTPGKNLKPVSNKGGRKKCSWARFYLVFLKLDNSKMSNPLLQNIEWKFGTSKKHRFLMRFRILRINFLRKNRKKDKFTVKPQPETSEGKCHGFHKKTTFFAKNR